MDLDTYLSRIGIDNLQADAAAPDLALLARLQNAHLLTVPFENIYIMQKRPLSLSISDLYEKIVVRRRGGICYELNGLFAELLRAFGFNVELLSAHVARKEGGFGPLHDHLTLLVHLDGESGRTPYLVDVGFGRSFREPLLLDGTISHANNEQYRVSRDGEDYLVEHLDQKALTEAPKEEVSEELTGEWKPDYKFDLTPYALSDFGEMCVVYQNGPSFTGHWLAGIMTPTGHNILRENELTIIDRAETRIVDIHGVEEFLRLSYSLIGIPPEAT